MNCSVRNIVVMVLAGCTSVVFSVACSEEGNEQPYEPDSAVQVEDDEDDYKISRDDFRAIVPHVILIPEDIGHHERESLGFPLGEKLFSASHGDWWTTRLSSERANELRTAGYEVVERDQLFLAASTDDDCLDVPEDNTFCAYAIDAEHCEWTISDYLLELPYKYDPSFIETIQVGVTEKTEMPILGVRIGNITEVGDPPSPQAIFLGGVHPNEAATPEMAMRIIQYFAWAYDNGKDGVPDLLSDRTLTVIPAANPEGIDQLDPERWQRTNQRPCPNDPDPALPGVDINRNFPLEFGQGSGSDLCDSGVYRGPEPFSETESEAIANVVENDSFVEPYETGLLIDFHQGGHFMTYAGGYDPDFDLCTIDTNLDPYRTNCSQPDAPVLQELFGTQRPANAVLRQITETDPEDGRPFATGELGRVWLSAAFMGGSIFESVHYGELLNGTQAYGGIVELTKWHMCGGDYRFVPPDKLSRLEENVIDFVVHTLERIDGVVAGDLADSIALPQVYRRMFEYEYPTVRFNVDKTLDNVDVSAPDGYSGSGEKDETMPGIEYQTWKWEPDDPYVLPGTLRVCAGDNCDDFVFDEATEVNLCTSDGWSMNDWIFVDQQGTEPAKECFFRVASDGEATLVRDEADLDRAQDWILNFSYLGDAEGNPDWHQDNLTVKVSTNDFEDCTWEEGTGCRIVRGPSADASNSARSTQFFRTERVDVSDFDGKKGVEVKFIAEDEEGLLVSDVVFSGMR